MLFENKIALVTGGGSGIGRATALQLAQGGATVLVTDINADNGTETANMILEAGGQAHFMPVDVSQPDDVRAMVQTALDRFGGLHIAINNAGVSGPFDKNLPDVSEDDYDLIMNVNVKGVWLGMKYEIPAMVQSGGGVIVNVASVAGLVAAPRGSVYAASKHAVIGLTRSAAVEMARKDIRINAVCPSFIQTPMVTDITSVSDYMAKATVAASPMKRLGQPQEVAETIVWLCSDAASFINGTALAVDGGLTAL